MTQDRDIHGGVKDRGHCGGKWSLLPWDVTGNGGTWVTEADTVTGKKELLRLTCLGSHSILLASLVNASDRHTGPTGPGCAPSGHRVCFPHLCVPSAQCQV